METKFIQKLSVVLILLAFISATSFAQITAKDKMQQQAKEQQKNLIKYNVTFIELGSVRCIPCQKMQSVMKSIKRKYANQVNVIFYDVWTPEGKPFIEKYGIDAIPTQIFLDENGKEFSRHEGFFPEEELIKVLMTKGVK